MNLEKRSCWRCGRVAVCFCEVCETCKTGMIVTCQRCFDETAGQVLDWQEASHEKRCGRMPMGRVDCQPAEAKILEKMLRG